MPGYVNARPTFLLGLVKLAWRMVVSKTWILFVSTASGCVADESPKPILRTGSELGNVSIEFIEYAGASIKGAEFEVVLRNKTENALCIPASLDDSIMVDLFRENAIDVILGDHVDDALFWELEKIAPIPFWPEDGKATKLEPQSTYEARVLTGYFRDPFYRAGWETFTFDPTEPVVARASLKVFPCRYETYSDASSEDAIALVRSNFTQPFLVGKEAFVWSSEN